MSSSAAVAWRATATEFLTLTAGRIFAQVHCSVTPASGLPKSLVYSALRGIYLPWLAAREKESFGWEGAQTPDGLTEVSGQVRNVLWQAFWCQARKTFTRSSILPGFT